MSSAVAEKTAPKTRLTREGVVDRARTDKTRRVVIEFLTRHPKYGKFIKRRTTLAVHDEKNVSNLGDTVEVMPCRPMSRTKRWKVVRVVQKAAGRAVEGLGAGEVKLP